MTSIIKKYKAFLVGFLITLLIAFILSKNKVVVINSEEIVDNLLIFLFWWVIISLVIANISNIKKNKVTFLKVLALLVLLTVIVFLEERMKEPNNPIIFILVGLFIVGIFLLIYEQWKWFKTLQSEKTKAELALLKNQINPHFFFNTLNNLYALTINNSKEAPEVILKLSDVMRYTIYQGKNDTVTLESEVEYLKNYLALHDIRYQKNVTIDFVQNIEENSLVAPLIFIILLENAIKHGVESLRNNAYISMSLTSKNDTIDFDIKNNFERNDVTKEEGGLGLENLKRRLELLYPEKHNLEISEKDSVFKVHLKIDVK